MICMSVCSFFSSFPLAFVILFPSKHISPSVDVYKRQYLDKEINVGGWVRSLRDSKAFGFIVVSDGSFFETLQIVYHDTLPNFAEVSKLSVGTAILVKGTLVSTPQAKQPFEIQASEVTVEGTSSPDYPLQKKRHSLEYLRTISRRLAPSSSGPRNSRTIRYSRPTARSIRSALPGSKPGASPIRIFMPGVSRPER